jgi:hypothetical protein
LLHQLVQPVNVVRAVVKRKAAQQATLSYSAKRHAAVFAANLQKMGFFLAQHAAGSARRLRK